MAFGPSYSYSLIRLLYGEKWSDGEASTALRCYCFYVIVLAMNGTSEAFMHAVATERQLKRSNDSLLIFSLIYIVLNVLLIRSAGAVGLILANSLRWITLLLSGIITLISENVLLDRDNFLRSFMFHLSVGLACFCVSSYVIYCREKPFIRRIIRFNDHVD